MRVSVWLAALLVWLAAVLPAQPPTPASHFGHDVTEDRKLLDWSKVVSYFQALQRSSPLIKVEELGRTVGGRPFIAATIASRDTLARLPEYQAIQTRLADPRITPPEQAENLISRGKAVVVITCSIHSTEVASTHTAVQFAYRLLTGDTPRFRAILDNVIFLLVPSLNPDGVDIVTQWYRKTLGTPHEGTSPPELYHLYLGHDNNRDWYIFSQPETRLTVSKLHNVWRPQIVYDVHQQGDRGSRMFVPPWLDPIEPNVDPLIAQQMNYFGMGIATDLTAAGKTGVVVNASYDFWTPARSYQSFHGGLRLLTETASARLATPVTISREQLDERALGFNARERSWNHLEPWHGGEWRLRDIISYQLIAFESVLVQAAGRREELLRNFYRIQQRQVARTQPEAFYIAPNQRDPGAARRLIETLRFGMVDVAQQADGGYRIPMAQPYSGWAKALLERQQYPDLRDYPGGPPRRPYDVTAHTLPPLMGVDVRESGGDSAPGNASPVKALAASDTDTWRDVNRMWKRGDKVFRNRKTGDFGRDPGDNWAQVRRPKLGLYRSHVPQMDEGWTRWILEQLEFAYTSVGNRELRAADLRRRFDVILFPDQPSSSIDSGFAAGTMPVEYCGGLGDEGREALREFATAGGTLIFLNRSTTYAVERLGIRARNLTDGLPNR
ncbi:MAG: M14 metallopeptidase family protein, partial [Bryobacteraceae bacterium]